MPGPCHDGVCITVHVAVLSHGGIVMIAEDETDIWQGLQQGYAPVGVGPVSHNISQADIPVNALAGCMADERLEGLLVGMDI